MSLDGLELLRHDWVRGRANADELATWTYSEAKLWIAVRSLPLVSDLLAYRLYLESSSAQFKLSAQRATESVAIAVMKQLASTVSQDPGAARMKFEKSLIEASVVGFGALRGAGDVTEIPPSDWIAADVVFNAGDASLVPSDPRAVERRWWGSLAFRRRDVLHAFPGEAEVINAGTSAAHPPAKPGRPKGTPNYDDAEIVATVIQLCDEGKFIGKARLRAAIKSLIERIGPASLEDEAKIKRIRQKVLKERADLSD